MIKRIGELNKEVANLKAEVDRLKAEVERLTKAGDALEDWIAWKCESPAGTAEPIIEAWNAAKEGKGQP
jgi:uncharacterized coiled-coil protein SlyX